MKNLFIGNRKSPSIEYLRDLAALATVVSLPWSTSVTAGLLVIWFLFSFRVLQPKTLRQVIATPAGWLPCVLWLAALLGMAWADVGWSERWHGMAGFHKLLVIPLVLSSTHDSGQARRMLGAFVISCAVLMMTSWLFVLWPGLAWPSRYWGVPVKDYIAQSGEFILCGFGLMHEAVTAAQRSRWRWSALMLIAAALFILNVFYIAAARTELVVLPALVLLFGWQRWGLRGLCFAVACAGVFVAVVWATSPYLRERLQQIPDEVQLAKTGQSARIAFYAKSIRFISAAPFIGHGTGTMAALFREAAIGKTEADAIATVNPHNQLLAVAIELGLFGGLLLIAMWGAHAILFWQAGEVGWLGLGFVVQNVISSMFNSHLFDFTQGWTYVFGIGAMGGAVLKRRLRDRREVLLEC